MAQGTPFPELTVNPTSGLSFAWAEYQPHVQGSSDASFGPDGVGLGMVILINFSDLSTALQELLGYSSRILTEVGPQIHRVIPWQHPYFPQMFVQRVSKVTPIEQIGRLSTPFNANAFGVGGTPNFGPYTNFNFALLTLQFWRPPYYVRTDGDILDESGVQQEWLRYVDKNWVANSQMLSREGCTFKFLTNQGTPSGRNFVGSVGQVVPKIKVKRTWYQVPEQAIFQPLLDATLNGLPYNMLYTQTETTNPITGLVYKASSPITGCINSPIGGSMLTVFGDTTITSPTINNIIDTAGISVGDEIVCSSFPSYSTVTALTGTTLTIDQNATATSVGENIKVDVASARFLGCYIGTLFLEAVELTPCPLQLPPELMNIPIFAANEPIAQLQYNVTFHFDIFDPPRAPKSLYRGHNLMPWSGDGLWYSIESQDNATGTATKATPFMYADFTDLFTIL